MLTGSFVTAAGFVPIGFARSSAGEYTFSIFAVVSIALIVSWFVAVLFAPLLGVWLLRAPKQEKDRKPSRIKGAFRALLLTAMRRRWMTVAITLACFLASLLALPLVPRQFFPASNPKTSNASRSTQCNSCKWLPSGRTVPLSQIARFEFDQEYPLIWRRDRVPTLTVQADVIPDSTPEAAASLAAEVGKLQASLPAGYRIAVGGTVEESANSQASVYAMVPAMLFLMPYGAAA